MGAAVMAALASAAASGLLASDASAQVARRRDEDSAPPTLIVVPPEPRILIAGHGSHRSHSSHSSHSSGSTSGHSSHASHRSHYSSSGGPGLGDSNGNYTADSPADVEPIVVEKPPPPPPPVRPAHVSFAVFPGGKISIDDKPAGNDATTALTLMPGRHVVNIVNRFIGQHGEVVEIQEGQTGIITITW
jgi:hypothetical protein